MRQTRLTVSALLAAACIGLIPLATHLTPPAAASNAAADRAPSEADRALVSLLDQDLEAQWEANPIEASLRGKRRYDHLMPDVSRAAIEARLEAVRDRLDRLKRIDRSALSDENRLNADLLAYEMNQRIAAARFHPEQTPITQQSGPQIALPQLPDRLTFTRRAHLESYHERLEAIPTYLEQVISNMRAGLEAGRTPPRMVMGSVEQQFGAVAHMRHVEEPSTHPLYQPFLRLEGDDPLSVSARRLIVDQIVPAFANLRSFIAEEYLPGCRETLAATDLPDGEAFYSHQLSSFTTTDMSAREIHELGKREVARIRAEMLEVIARSDYENTEDLEGDELLAAFINYLRTDDRFYHDTAADLLRGYRDICKRMDAELPRLFGKLPRLTYGVQEMPAFMAPSAPTAYYYPGSLENGAAGYFVANTHRLDQRPRYEMVPLALHEAVPGHHFQIALAQELEDAGLHEWRTNIGYTAYVEGWGLYAERLGLEVGGGDRGFYSDPYNDFGRLTYEMWRALRLVVDTGMHAFDWRRDEAVEYMLANSALTEANVESEVNRYIAWPGQATGYKIGEIRIRALRDRAETALGEDFDIRAFHDMILGAGSLPLPVLEERVNAWITSERSE